MGPNYEGDFSMPATKCVHGVWAPRSIKQNDCCSICMTPLASKGSTKREVMDIALKSVGVRIKRVLKMKEEEEVSQSVETDVVEKDSEAPEGSEADAEEVVGSILRDPNGQPHKG
jgi:hypothetical protein